MLQSCAAPGTKLGDVQDEFKLFEAGKAILAEVLTENALAKGVMRLAAFNGSIAACVKFFHALVL